MGCARLLYCKMQFDHRQLGLYQPDLFNKRLVDLL